MLEVDVQFQVHTHIVPNKKHSMQSLTQHETITNCDESRQSVLKRIYFMFVITLKKHTIALSFQQTYNTNKNQTVVLPRLGEVILRSIRDLQ